MMSTQRYRGRAQRVGPRSARAYPRLTLVSHETWPREQNIECGFRKDSLKRFFEELRSLCARFDHEPLES